MAKLEPFNFDGLKAFSMPYLAGFESSGYDFDDEALAPAVKDKVTHYAEDYIRGGGIRLHNGHDSGKTGRLYP